MRTERAWGELWETTDDQPGDAGVLTALLSSHDGAAFAVAARAPPTASSTSSTASSRCLRGLAGERVLTDWTNDPYSLGAYVAFGPGQCSAALAVLHDRYGRLLLAGEHTDAWAGYMEGALRSGARAAARVLA